MKTKPFWLRDKLMCLFHTVNTFYWRNTWNFYSVYNWWAKYPYFTGYRERRRGDWLAFYHLLVYMKEKWCFLSILVHGYHTVLYTSDQYLYSRFVICLNNILYFSMQWQQYMLLTWCIGNIICHLHDELATLPFICMMR